MCTLIHPSDDGDGRGQLSWPLFGNRRNILTFLPHTHLCPLPLNHWDQSINLVLILYLSERRISAISGDPHERNQLFQRLSICTQQFNAVAFRGAFEDFSGDEAWYFQNGFYSSDSF